MGVRSVEGRFEANDIVDIKDATGHLFARGKVAFASDEAALAIGRTARSCRRTACWQAGRQAARPSRRVGRLRIGEPWNGNGGDQVRRIARRRARRAGALAQTSADERNGAGLHGGGVALACGRHRRGERLRHGRGARPARRRPPRPPHARRGPRRSHGGRARGPVALPDPLGRWQSAR
ncbi:MAG: PUA domain-containing protein [Eggerthellaceae bacterium]